MPAALQRAWPQLQASAAPIAAEQPVRGILAATPVPSVPGLRQQRGQAPPPA